MECRCKHDNEVHSLAGNDITFSLLLLLGLLMLLGNQGRLLWERLANQSIGSRVGCCKVGIDW